MNTHRAFACKHWFNVHFTPNYPPNSYRKSHIVTKLKISSCAPLPITAEIMALLLLFTFPGYNVCLAVNHPAVRTSGSSIFCKSFFFFFFPSLSSSSSFHPDLPASPPKYCSFCPPPTYILGSFTMQETIKGEKKEERKIRESCLVAWDFFSNLYNIFFPFYFSFHPRSWPTPLVPWWLVKDFPGLRRLPQVEYIQHSWLGLCHIYHRWKGPAAEARGLQETAEGHCCWPPLVYHTLQQDNELNHVTGV